MALNGERKREMDTEKKEKGKIEWKNGMGRDEWENGRKR